MHTKVQIMNICVFSSLFFLTISCVRWRKARGFADTGCRGLRVSGRRYLQTYFRCEAASNEKHPCFVEKTAAQMALAIHTLAGYQESSE